MKPCGFCFACKLLKSAYFAILANSLQINVII
nr:MAG TPA: restriction alleviation protein [Caudoviricetes sp.]